MTLETWSDHPSPVSTPTVSPWKGPELLQHLPDCNFLQPTPNQSGQQTTYQIRAHPEITNKK